MLICALSFFFKQKTAYEMRISDWSSDVCSSDLRPSLALALALDPGRGEAAVEIVEIDRELVGGDEFLVGCRRLFLLLVEGRIGRSEEHTSELQSLMRISYAVFCLKKKKQTNSTILSRHKLMTIEEGKEQV